MKKKDAKPRNATIENRKARHEYHIGDIFEAGIVLAGTEVKSIRLGKASLTESYCKLDNNELWIVGMYVAPYEQGSRFNTDPIRPRKLLMHNAEIDKIRRGLDEKGYTLVPLKLYFTRGFAKITVALARGKKLWDKRDAIAERDVERDRRREESERY